MYFGVFTNSALWITLVECLEDATMNTDEYGLNRKRYWVGAGLPLSLDGTDPYGDRNAVRIAEETPTVTSKESSTEPNEAMESRAD